MEALLVLEDVIAKTAKNTSNENRSKAVSALKELSSDGNNTKQVAEYLVKLHYSVCQAYFENVAASISYDILSSIVSALLEDEQFKKGNPNNILYPKGFTSALALAKKGKHQFAFSILNFILMQAEKPEGFSDSCKKNFKKIVIDKSGLSFMQEVLNSVNEGIVPAEDFEKRRLLRFLVSVVETPVITTVTANVPTPVSVTTASIKPEDTLKKGENPQDTPPNAETEAAQPSVAKIEASQTEILSVLRKLTEDRAAIDNLTVILKQKESEFANACIAIREKEQRTEAVSAELRDCRARLDEAEIQIADLTDRLRTSLNMDEISKNQELATLRNDISEALKLDYSDFMGTKGSECSQDLFEAYRSTLTRIFKLLKRFGITCE